MEKLRTYLFGILFLGLLIGCSKLEDPTAPKEAKNHEGIYSLQKSGKVTICHKPGTPAQKTLEIPIQALKGHLGHGDAIGACCVATTGAEYVISGGPDPDAGIFVDDILRVFVNASLVAEVSQGGRCCPPVAPIRFVANTGDILRVQAQDANDCYSLEALWLQKADGSCLTQLTGDIFGPNCGSEPPEQIFFDQTFTLP